MDTSETYIKMCDCPEIQEQKGYKCGDWYVLTRMPETFKFRIECESTDVEDDNSGDHPYTKLRQIKDRTEDGYLWLPRQDQLQEMLKETHGDFFTMFIFFWHEFLTESGDFRIPSWSGVRRDGIENGHKVISFDKVTSMEQLWLAFVMKEKHNKVWNGEEWRC